MSINYLTSCYRKSLHSYLTCKTIIAEKEDHRTPFHWKLFHFFSFFVVLYFSQIQCTCLPLNFPYLSLFPFCWNLVPHALTFFLFFFGIKLSWASNISPLPDSSSNIYYVHSDALSQFSLNNVWCRPSPWTERGGQLPGRILLTADAAKPTTVSCRSRL